MACGHSYWVGQPRATRFFWEPGRLPSAALISNSEDLGRYLSALLARDERLLPAAGWEQLFAPGVQAGEFSHAMGWRTGQVRGVPVISHGGYLYDFRGKLVMLPEQGMGIAVLTNASAMFGRVTSHEIANGVAAIIAGTEPARPGLSLTTLLRGAGLVEELWGLRKWKARLIEARAARGLRRYKPVLALIPGLLVPPFLLVGLPALLSMRWSELLRAMPDVGWWMWVYAPLGWGLALWKLGTMLRDGCRGRRI